MGIQSFFVNGVGVQGVDVHGLYGVTVSRRLNANGILMCCERFKALRSYTSLTVNGKRTNNLLKPFTLMPLT